jgi:uncharacterized protein
MQEQMPVKFDWTLSKADSNERKHGLDFRFGIRVFKDRRHIIYDVSRSKDGEERFKAVGMVDGKLYCVVFTMRDDVCRIISARRTNAGEDRAYANLRT